jgi:3-oxoacyl-[acyl-carrier protein] reductase/2-deoxy-D-gluconate 3-dehydrogenase
VNIASVWGLLGRPGFTAYCASKGAMVNFTRSAAAEWARFGAQMNAVAPGYFATDINADFRADAEAVAKVLRRVPARRMGEPIELANLVSYLALDAPDFLTGQTIALDGGESSV